MKITELLNPIDSDMARRRSSHHRQRATQNSQGASESSQARSKQKLIKDAPIFAKNAPRGTVNYPPFESTDQSLVHQHKRFKIYPAGQISEFPRHIPYNSDKIGFLSKTGRDAFEVFQYTFRVPGQDKEWTVMWDYNIGLVRVTPFFKALGHAKTIPGKVLQQNVGLKSICYSITGGALAAQGYWMPFEAAKALAATFCYDIRHALTPVFGPEILTLCIVPEDPIFGRMLIDSAVIADSTAQKTSWRSASSRRRPTARRLDKPAPPQKRLRPRIAAKSKDDAANHHDTDSVSETPIYASSLLARRTSGFTAINQAQLAATSAATAATVLLPRPRGSKRLRPDALDAIDPSTIETDPDSPGFAASVDKVATAAVQAVAAAIAPVPEREQASKRRCGVFSATEARAAYLLLTLNAVAVEFGVGAREPLVAEEKAEDEEVEEDEEEAEEGEARILD